MRPELDRLADAFLDLTGSRPSGIWSAPGRVNLLGEHTDYNDGHVLPFAVADRTYAALRERNDEVVRVVSLQQDGAVECPTTELRSASGWSAYVLGTVWALREEGLPVQGLDVVVDGTVPLGAGLSSSAALECAVALGLNDLCQAVGPASPSPGRVSGPSTTWSAPRSGSWTRPRRCCAPPARRCCSTAGRPSGSRSRSTPGGATPAARRGHERLARSGRRAVRGPPAGVRGGGTNPRRQRPALRADRPSGRCGGRPGRGSVSPRPARRDRGAAGQGCGHRAAGRRLDDARPAAVRLPRVAAGRLRGLRPRTRRSRRGSGAGRRARGPDDRGGVRRQRGGARA